MDDRINLESRASVMLGELATDQKYFDLDALRDAVSDRVHEEADNCVIYTHHALNIINEYERHEAAPSESELGGTYRADQYREAATAWAYEIAAAVLSAEASDILDRVEEYADALCADVSKVDENEAPSVDDLTATLQCPHGWAPHDREDSDGTHYWLPAQLEGCHAVAIDCGPFWLSYTWTPESDEE